MALRYVLLAAGAALVLGVGVYLFFEVRSRPAEARGPERAIAAGGAGGATATASGAEDDGPPARDRAPVARPPEAAPPAAPTGPVVREPPRGPDGEPQDPAPHKLPAAMDEANKAYDRGDLDEAKAIAKRVLRLAPNNARMLRIVVSASCISGENAEAQAAFLQLPQADREQMKTRCARYGVSFTEP